MLVNKKILVAGGDLRNTQLIKRLSLNNEVYSIALEDSVAKKVSVCELREENVDFDFIILPLLATDENNNLTAFTETPIKIDDILSLATEKTYVLGGKLGKYVTSRLDTYNIQYVDYLLREEFAIKNAVPTAEGAIQIAMQELPTTFSGQEILIIGYGRIGKVLANCLKPFNSNIRIVARKYADLAWVEVNGFVPVNVKDISKALAHTNIIFNTVPAILLKKNELMKLPKDSLLIDLASKPGGIDFDIAKQLGLKTIWALSLPGKVAPITAGNIIFDTVSNIADIIADTVDVGKEERRDVCE